MKSAHFASSHSINRRTFLLTAGALALVELSRAQETASERVPEHCLRDVPRLESIDGKDYAFCNVGSSTGKYGFDWDGAGVHGVNLATQPQTLAQGFALLRHFAGRLAKGCVVVIPICPFSSVLPFYRTLDEQYKMYPFAKPSEIPFWTPARAQAVAAALPRVRAKWKGIDPDLTRPDRTPSPEAFRRSVEDLCACWRRQFEITDFNAPLNERNRKTFAETVPIMCDGLRMCVANGWRPIIVLPPISRHYDEVFKPVFWKTYVSDFVAAANPVKAPYWDYGANPRFRDDSLYANSLMLNRKGRALFTAEIVQRVERSMKT